MLCSNNQMRNADFVIVGAGSAGCVLASEIVRRNLGRVLLIETGSVPNSRHLKVPSEYPLAFQGKHAWRHTTVPQARLANRRLMLPAGKTLGGSSSLNALIYLRGHPTDFDRWEQSVGPDWNRTAVAHAFEAVETAIGQQYLTAPELHPALSMFLAKAAAVPDLQQHPFFREPAQGLGQYRRCQSNGRRRSAWDIWRKRSQTDSAKFGSFEIITGTSVQHLVIQGDRVAGVAMSLPESPRSDCFVAARKGVIVCAGAIRSPQLLLASGIGDSADLAEIRIPCRVNAPGVGKNLQDHLVFPVVHALKQFESLAYPASESERVAYAKHRTGPRASNIAEAGGFFALPGKAQGGDGMWHANESRIDFQWHLTPTHYLHYPNRREPTAAMSLAVNLSRPASRGSVRLKLASTSDSKEKFAVEIDPAYLSMPSDMHDFLKAIRWTRSMLEAECFSELLGLELLPGSKRQSDSQMVAAIERFATTIYHYAGTCAMGYPSSGVVDSRFRVHGLEGLWVCDASTMPSLISCNTQATVTMMAYRLAGWLEA